MNFRIIAYTVVSLLALGYLLIANARGYDPFATPTTRATRGTGAATVNHFHK